MPQEPARHADGLSAQATGLIRHHEHVGVPDEWLALMADSLLAQSAVDRVCSTAHELIIEGESYRRRQKPTTGVSVDTNTEGEQDAR